MKKTVPSTGKRIPVIPPFVYFLFLILAFISALALDYISREKEERSLFSLSPLEKKKNLASQDELREIILKSLSFYGIAAHDVQQYKDRNNILHLKIDFPSRKYSLLQSKLKDKLKEANASILKKVEQQSAEKSFYLWEVEAKGRENLIVLFSCSMEERVALERERRLFGDQRKNKIAIIIDDMGYNLEDLKKIISLKKPFTVSILPFSPYAKETALIAHENGLEVMLHLPLESVNSENKNIPEGYILSRMSKEEIEQTLEENLQIPHLKGVNNHQGSKITTDEALMRIILEYLKSRSLYFIDSLTTSHSIAYKLAQEMEIPSARRYIFLDSMIDEEYIRGKLEELFLKAQKRKITVVICHPFKETLRALKEKIHLADENNLELVFASQIVH